MQAIASLSRGVGVALQGVVRGVVRNQSTTEPARAGGPEPADSRLGDYLCILPQGSLLFPKVEFFMKGDI